MDFHRVVIQQVDCFGPGKHRFFVLHKPKGDLDECMFKISRAYNMERTKVTIDGKYHMGVR